MRKLHEEQLRDIVLGAGLMGGGGGGSIAEGMRLVDRVLEFGEAVELVTPEELPESAWGAVIAGVGSPKSSLHLIRTKSPTLALELLEQAVGKRFSFVIPFEVGAGNSINPMLASIQKGIPIIDGDPCGRAVPEINMTTFHLGGIPITPLALSTEDRISAIIRTPVPHDAERVTRAITAELGGVSAIAAQHMSAADLKRLVIPGTTSIIERVGRSIRETRSKHGDVVEVLRTRFKGHLLGKGRVAGLSGETRNGFDFGCVELEGGLPVKVFFQNESMIALREEELLAVVPDLICCLDHEGNPLTNADIAEGMDVVYIGFAGHPMFRKPEAYNLFTTILSRLGYESGFRPIENLAAGGKSPGR